MGGMRTTSLMATALLTAMIPVAVLVAPTAVAEEGADPPQLFAGSEPGSFWVAYQFSTVEDSEIVAETRADDVRPPDQGAYLLYDQNNMLLGGSIFTFLRGSSGVYVDVNPAPGVNAHIDQRLTTASPTRYTVTLNGESGEKITGTFKLLMWLASDIRQPASFSFNAEDGTQLLSVRHSPRAFLHTFEDFSGIASADVGFNAGLRANILTSLEKPIAGTFIGSYFSPLSADLDISMDGPEGHALCPCERYTYAQGDPEGDPAQAGNYTFNYTGVGAGTGTRELLLGGVDVVLPEVADLGITSVEAAGLPASLPVGQSTLVEVSATVANSGPFGPVNALVDVAATTMGGLAAEPPEEQATVPTLAAGQEETRTLEFLVQCSEPGQATLTLSASVTSPGDYDPNPVNNTLERFLSIDCV